MTQKIPPDTQTKEKQRALLFPVVKPAVKTSVATPAYGILGVRISLIFDIRVLMPIKDALKGKSIWKGQGEEVVNVEIYALQHYERLGYKGYHCEGRIVTTLFGLLFWDIIFAPIPGAFETPYQTAPLDIFEDTFYHAREELIETRLDEISRNNARQIMQNVDDEHRERGTWCLGVRWDLFPKEDLLEIAEVCADLEEFLTSMTFRAVFQRGSISLFMSYFMRRLCPAWVRGPRSLHMELCRETLQVCRGQGSRRQAAGESESTNLFGISS